MSQEIFTALLIEQFSTLPSPIAEKWILLTADETSFQQRFDCAIYCFLQLHNQNNKLADPIKELVTSKLLAFFAFTLNKNISAINFYSILILSIQRQYWPNFLELLPVPFNQLTNDWVQLSQGQITITAFREKKRALIQNHIVSGQLLAVVDSRIKELFLHLIGKLNSSGFISKLSLSDELLAQIFHYLKKNKNRFNTYETVFEKLLTEETVNKADLPEQTLQELNS